MKKSISSEKKFWLNFLSITNIVAFAGVLVVNYLANALPIGGNSTGALSDLYPNLFTPAGLTFSIRWLIYLSVLWFVIWQIVDLHKKISHNITKKIWIWFIVSCLINVSRIFAWHYKLVFLSVIIMLLFLVTLIIIDNRVENWKKLWKWTDKLLVQVPFSLYLWWISVATIANISAFLVNIWWNARWISDIFWTILVILVATILAILNLYKNANIIFALVVIRAFLWIIIKRVDVDPVYASSIIWTLWICISVISAGIWLKFNQRKNN